MWHITTQRSKVLLKIILAILVVVFLSLCIMLVREYKNVRQLYFVSGQRTFFAGLRRHAPAIDREINSLQSWMTFDYINHLFILPSEYLRTTLAITDARYPRMTIAELAEDKRITKANSLAEVQNALKVFFAQKQ